MRNTGRSLGELPDARGREVLARQKPSGVCLLRPDPFGDVELHSAAECFIAQMRICDLRVRIVRDGHEPNEAEEQRPCCVPIEPVHAISSPKDRREQEGYQNSGSFGEKSWVTSQILIHYLSRGRPSLQNMVTRSRIAWQSSLASPSASTIAAPSAFCDTFPIAKTPGNPLEQQLNLCGRSRSSCHLLALKHPSRSWCLDCFLPIPHGFNHRKHRRRYLDMDYCTASPCNARSRPSRSVSSVTRRPTNILTTRRMIKLATAS